MYTINEFIYICARNCGKYSHRPYTHTNIQTRTHMSIMLLILY